MMALVHHGGRLAWDEVADPRVVDPTDAVVAVGCTSICGVDQHIVSGDVPGVADGRVLGHEAVGTVVAVGDSVATVRPGDRVLVSCISACGHCRFCRAGMYGQCTGGGGWILGRTVDGTQAEYVRVPFADTSVHTVPDGLDSDVALMLADVVPTGYEVGAVNGAVRPGDTVAVVGAGPVGLAAALACRLYSPRRVVVVDPTAVRRDAAKRFGADVVVDPAGQDPVAAVLALTEGLGADVVVEAVGRPDTFGLCASLVRPGGHVANVGVHGGPATLHLEELWRKSVTITTGLVDTWSTPMLLDLVTAGLLDPTPLATHRFALDDVLEAYRVLDAAADTGALKVVLHNTRIHAAV